MHSSEQNVYVHMPLLTFKNFLHIFYNIDGMARVTHLVFNRVHRIFMRRGHDLKNGLTQISKRSLTLLDGLITLSKDPSWSWRSSITLPKGCEQSERVLMLPKDRSPHQSSPIATLKGPKWPRSSSRSLQTVSNHHWSPSKHGFHFVWEDADPCAHPPCAPLVVAPIWYLWGTAKRHDLHYDYWWVMTHSGHCCSPQNILDKIGSPRFTQKTLSGPAPACPGKSGATAERSSSALHDMKASIRSTLCRIGTRYATSWFCFLFKELGRSRSRTQAIMCVVC